ncbi:LamG-like jellyroll fold domain-containing protein [Catenovulum agarivorans]|uniref:LamG-like jellyroll fold domain-containing protein n=1 Tax=Catenovulum agarivorans TaxID=1172192 RepID=UPI0002D358C0|nr:LamG-like jellyroll fold domain-containing protein [Catenovulum agarivorans]
MKRSEKFADIREIADEVCSNTATTEQLQQLEKKLKDDPEAKLFYFDYLRVHNGLKSAADRNMEIVYRRIRETEEVIIRPQGESAPDGATIIEQGAGVNVADIPKWKNIILVVAIIVSLILLVIFTKTEQAFSAHISQGQLNIESNGRIDSDTLYGGEYSVAKDAVLTLNNGDIFELAAGSRIKLFTHSEIQLIEGQLNIIAVSGQNIIVDGTNFKLNSNGDDLSVNLTNNQPEITSGKNTTIIPQRWRPQHYWPFDSDSDRAVNLTNNAHGVPAFTATKVKGLVGDGAYYFDNTQNARIELGTGGGSAPATGTFSATDGVTIEALIAPKFTGEKGEMDEIFRKGHLDGELRVSLALHNIAASKFMHPVTNTLENLSFGLHIVGQGYQELKLMLDGKDGRPTLAELTNGDMYHVVASYDAKTGLKALYINGKMLASYQYPAGSKLLVGGPGNAAIGNNPTKRFWDKFAYYGIIDEVAYYDFALPPLMVSAHFEHVKQGKNYYGFQPNIKALPEQPQLQLPANKQLKLDSSTGLPARLIN